MLLTPSAPDMLWHEARRWSNQLFWIASFPFLSLSHPGLLLLILLLEVLLLTFNLISLTAWVRLSFSWMRVLMVRSVITSLSSSFMNFLLCLPSSSWLDTTRDSSWDISDSCCSFNTEKKYVNIHFVNQICDWEVKLRPNVACMFWIWCMYLWAFCSHEAF